MRKKPKYEINETTIREKFNEETGIVYSRDPWRYMAWRRRFKKHLMENWYLIIYRDDFESYQR